MFQNNNLYFEELQFFQENSNGEPVLRPAYSAERLINPFVENMPEIAFDFTQAKWSTYPNYPLALNKSIGSGAFQRSVSNNSENNNQNQLVRRNLSDKKSNEETYSNLADTEEHLTLVVSNNQVQEKVEKNEDCGDVCNTNDLSYEAIKFNDRDVDELLDMINHPTTDMNALLSEVLNAGPTDPTIKRKRAITKEVKGRRVRKTKDQIEALVKEYEINSEWDNDEINAIAAKLGLKKKQVYKWYWDQKRKSGDLKKKSW